MCKKRWIQTQSDNVNKELKHIWFLCLCCVLQSAINVFLNQLSSMVSIYQSNIINNNILKYNLYHLSKSSISFQKYTTFMTFQQEETNNTTGKVASMILASIWLLINKWTHFLKYKCGYPAAYNLSSVPYTFPFYGKRLRVTPPYRSFQDQKNLKSEQNDHTQPSYTVLWIFMNFISLFPGVKK